MDAIKVCLRRCFSFFDNLKINACLCFSTRFPKIFFRFYPIKIYISKIKKIIDPNHRAILSKTRDYILLPRDVYSVHNNIISIRKSHFLRKRIREELVGRTVIQRVKMVGATRALTSSSELELPSVPWRWHATIAGWMAFHVGWRDDLKFKARAARVVRSLTEYHDRCHGSQSSQLLRGLANFSPFFRGMVPHSLLDVAHADPIRRHKLARYSPCRDFPPPILPPPFSAREKSRHYAFYKSIGIILSELSAVSSRTRSFYSDSSCFFLLFSLFFFRKRRYIGKINFIGIDESMYLRFHLNFLPRRVSLGREYIFRFEK